MIKSRFYDTYVIYNSLFKFSLSLFWYNTYTCSQWKHWKSWKYKIEKIPEADKTIMAVEIKTTIFH